MDAKLMCDGAWRWPWTALALCGVGLMACSPTYNWRNVPLDGAALKAQLANFKIPKRCFVVGELPRNTMGKVQKNLLREQHKGLFA